MSKRNVRPKRMDDVVQLVLMYQNAALRDRTMPDVQLYMRYGDVSPVIQIAPDAYGVGLYGGKNRKAGEGFGDGVKRIRELLAEHQIGGFADGQT